MEENKNEAEVPKILKKKWFRVMLYLLAIIGVIDAGCWLIIGAGSFLSQLK